MPPIRASCPDCGDVMLSAADMTVRVCNDDARGAYSFRCPTCKMTVSKPAATGIVDLLVSKGVRLETWDLPKELWEPRVGQPIDHDDLLAFHELMESADWFTVLSGMVEK